jgi:hypothetical protein
MAYFKVTTIDGRSTSLLSEYKSKQDMFAHMRELGGEGTKFTCVDRQGRRQEYLITKYGYLDTRNRCQE